ncbi:hypothetical protein PHYC_01000 [Phycisphaerales bacterium]|nr:hypothetical protein PHYC_01000 [Phycisphaerales bacterium]
MSIRRAASAVLASILLTTLVACEDKINQENYDKVTIGMSQAEVFKILGKGQREEPTGMNISGAGIASGSNQTSQTTYTWRKGNTEIGITFENGKVVNRMMR